MLYFVSLSGSFTDHCLLLVAGFYGQLQTFCPPHYADSQKNVQHGVSCNTVPSFEDCLVPTSAGQASLGIFHRTFSAHSGITGKWQLGALRIAVYSLWTETDLPELCVGLVHVRKSWQTWYFTKRRWFSDLCGLLGIGTQLPWVTVTSDLCADCTLLRASESSNLWGPNSP